MKLRVPAAILMSLALLLAACGDDSDDDRAQRAIAEALEEAQRDFDRSTDSDHTNSDDADNNGNNNNDGRDTADSTGRDGTGRDGTGRDGTDNAGAGSNGSGTGPSSMLDLGDCMEVSLAFAALSLASFGEMMGAEMDADELNELQDAFEGLADKLPNELKADFETVADAYNTAASEGFASGRAQEVLSSDRFAEANERIGEHIEDLCG